MPTRSRRRKKNPLLARILIFSIVAHVIALPIAAHFGAFEKIRRQFGDSTVVMFSTPPVETPEKAKPKEKPKEKKAATGKKAPSGAHSAGKSANLPQPKVVTGGPTGDGGGDGPTAVSGTNAAGVLPTTGGTTAPKTGTTTTPPPITPVEQPKTVVTKNDTPKPVTPVVVAEKKVEPKPKRIVEAQQTDEAEPEPVIPDDLRTEPLDKTLYVEADIDVDGKPQNVKVTKSTGVRELDDIGLETARKYHFHPATVDDVPVEQHVQFQIRFQVS